MTAKGIKAAIALEFYEAARKLGAKSDLLSIIGSYGDTLKDQDVLEALRYWNEAHADLSPPGAEAPK
jgi:hypothetical protein